MLKIKKIRGKEEPGKKGMRERERGRDRESAKECFESAPQKVHI